MIPEAHNILFMVGRFLLGSEEKGEEKSEEKTK